MVFNNSDKAYKCRPGGVEDMAYKCRPGGVEDAAYKCRPGGVEDAAYKCRPGGVEDMAFKCNQHADAKNDGNVSGNEVRVDIIIPALPF